MIERRAILAFLAFAFAWSWTTCEVYYRLIGASPAGDAALSFVFMWGPGLAALLTAWWMPGRARQWIGPVFAFNRYLIPAMLLPALLIAGHTLLAAAAPATQLHFDAASLAEALLGDAPQEQREALRSQTGALGDRLPWIMLVQVVLGGLIGGLTVTAVAALGEELGWRGFLHRAFASLGFWPRSLAIGSIWGVWHLPLMLRGHNLPEAPLLAALLMILYCMLLSPLLEHLRQRSGAVLAPVVLHGVMNATATGALVFVSGSPAWWHAPIGGAALMVLAVATGIVAWLRRSEPADSWR